MTIVQEILELKRLIKNSFNEGHIIKISNINFLFENRAAKHLEIEERLGRIEIENGEIVNINY